MHKFVAAVTSAAVLASSCAPAFAIDSMPAGWQRKQGPAAIAYFKMPLGTEAQTRPIYGFALTAPMPRTYGVNALSLVHRPMLVDMRFAGAVPDSLRVSGRIAWTQNPAGGPDGERQNLLGLGLIGTALSLASVAAGAWGIYELTRSKNDCPAGQARNSAGACAPVSN